MNAKTTAPMDYSQAAARLAMLRSEFLALHRKQDQYQHTAMTDQDAAVFDSRAAELRDEISVLKDHMGRLQRFEALVARSRGRNKVGGCLNCLTPTD